jgi:hypothetical protein
MLSKSKSSFRARRSLKWRRDRKRRIRKSRNYSKTNLLTSIKSGMPKSISMFGKVKSGYLSSRTSKPKRNNSGSKNSSFRSLRNVKIPQNASI